MPSGTTTEAEQVQLRLLREKSPSERAGMALRDSAEIIQLAKRAIQRVNPGLTESEIGRRFIELQYGKELAQAAAESGGSGMDGSIEMVDALRPVLYELDRLGVRYYISAVRLPAPAPAWAAARSTWTWSRNWTKHLHVA